MYTIRNMVKNCCGWYRTETLLWFNSRPPHLCQVFENLHWTRSLKLLLKNLDFFLESVAGQSFLPWDLFWGLLKLCHLQRIRAEKLWLWMDFWLWSIFPYLSFEFSSIMEKHYHDVLVNLCHRYHILHLLFITSTQIFNILFLSAKSRCNIIPRPSFWKRKILPPTCFLNFSMIA